ncbi:MAG: exodeoxyribonuclease VII large subunit [Patescibacteria group bacterium]
MPEAVLRVSEFLQLTNEVLRQNIMPNAFAIEGEISGFTLKDGKWIIFSLKDEVEPNVKLKCFATSFKVTGAFEDGMKVRVWGVPSVKTWSDFQLTVERMEAVGEGALKRAYEALKKKLELEGMLDISRKRDLPRFPQRIGLITSSDAAAYGDFLRILNNRWGGVVVEHANVRVQGKDAVEQILAAFEAFNKSTSRPQVDITRPCDVIVLTRGGGSIEDLHAFNDEMVVRAVYASKIPVVCGVGHERDESLCDYVADVRASTPSNAAERVVPSREEVLFEIEMIERVMDERFCAIVNEKKTVLENFARLMTHQVHRQKLRLETLIQTLGDRATRWITTLKTGVDSSSRLLANLDPTRILSRGYAIATSGGRVVKDASSLEVGASIKVRLSHGSFDSEVKQLER